GYTVAIGHHERAVANAVGEALEPSTGFRQMSRVHQFNCPVEGFFGVVAPDLPRAHIDSQVAVQRAVVGDVLLDHGALVAEGDHEILQPVVTVVAHDMPQNRTTPDFDHRLRLDIS